MPRSHIEVGKCGEVVAVQYLRKSGYQILSCNTKIGGVEVDILARQGEDIVIVEVKTNSGSEEAFRPSLRVDHKKIERLRRAAETWIGEQREDLGARIDVVEVCSGKVMEHFEDITG